MSAPTTSPHLPRVGDRLSFSSHRATVRYVGQVPPTRGVWLGVDWDDPARGKHDGVHDGKRYFECRFPNSGSFIRPMASHISYGASFLAALTSKYAPSSSSSAVGPDSLLTPPPGGYGRTNLADIEIEMPRLDGVVSRVKRLELLREVGLGGWKAPGDVGNEVATAFAEGQEKGDIKATCPNVTYLDLSRSLLPSWDEVALIARELPRLETLVLHFNRFRPLSSSSLSLPPSPSFPSEAPTQTLLTSPSPLHTAFLNLLDVRLDSCLLSWDEVCRLSPFMPRLQVLQLGCNGIRVLRRFPALSLDQRRMEDLRQETEKKVPRVRGGEDEGGQINGDVDVELFPKLRVLNLEGNHIEDWQEVADGLGGLPSLERLILTSNKINRIPAPPSSSSSPAVASHPLPPSPPQPSSIFPALTHLGLTGNPISSWSDIDHLRLWTRSGTGLESLSLGESVSNRPEEEDGSGVEEKTQKEKRCLVDAMPYKDLKPLLIARTGSLKTLNGSQINPYERKDAELFYLSRIAAELSSFLSSSTSEGSATMSREAAETEMRRRHPRWRELCELYGVSTDVQSVGGKGRGSGRKAVLKDRLIDLTIHFTSSPPLPRPPYIPPAITSPRVQMRVLPTMPVRLLRLKLSKALKVPQKELGTVWAVLSAGDRQEDDERGSDGEEEEEEEEGRRSEMIVLEMDDPSREVGWYDLQSGDDVLVVKPS